MKCKPVTAVLLLFLTLFFVRCTPDMDFPEPVPQMITEGNWSVNYFYSNGDQTARLSLLGMRFHANGTFTSVHNATTYTGAWQVLKKVGADALRIQLPESSSLVNELNKEWDIVSLTSNGLELRNEETIIRLIKL